MPMPITFTVPIKTISPNQKEHWTKSHQRNKQHRFILKAYLNNRIEEVKLPCSVTLTRIASRKLDKEENLPMAFKFIKDCIADFLIPGKPPGHADSDPRIQWLYNQEKGEPKQYAIKIEINHS